MDNRKIYFSLLRACNDFENEGVAPAATLCWVAAFRMIPEGELGNHAWIETPHPDDEPGEYDTRHDLLGIGIDELHAFIPVPMLAEKVAETCYEQCVRIPRREYDRQVDATRKASVSDEVAEVIRHLAQNWEEMHKVLNAEAITRSVLAFLFYNPGEAERLLSRMNELVGGYALEEELVDPPFGEEHSVWRVWKTF